MRKGIYIVWLLIIVLTSCKDDDINLFDKSADERVADAIAALKDDLTDPAHGWKVKYKPESGSGSFWVFMKFQEDNKLIIETDLGSNSGEFFQDTITYRIDSSLGLELIVESYSFFSFLFEQDQATFGAEYEFNYVNKTPDGELVFSSKSDFSSPTVLLFEEADQNEADAVLAKTLSTNLNQFTSSARINYIDKDLAIFLSMDPFKRTAAFNYISKKTNLLQGQALNHFTGYILRSDSIVFEKPLIASFNGNSVNLKGLLLNDFGEITVNVCPAPTTEPLYKGLTSSGDKITFETSLFNYDGAEFKDREDIYYGSIFNIFDENGQRVSDKIQEDIAGAVAMLIYNNYQSFNAIGFFIENPDGSTAIAVREHTATFTGNVVELTFASDITLIRTTSANVNNIDIYLDLMTEGGKTYIYKINENFYELYNPCSGWRFVFEALNI
jgi:hypothetical protein